MKAAFTCSLWRSQHLITSLHRCMFPWCPKAPLEISHKWYQAAHELVLSSAEREALCLIVKCVRNLASTPGEVVPLVFSRAIIVPEISRLPLCNHYQESQAPQPSYGASSKQSHGLFYITTHTPPVLFPVWHCHGPWYSVTYLPSSQFLQLSLLLRGKESCLLWEWMCASFLKTH